MTKHDASKSLKWLAFAAVGMFSLAASAQVGGPRINLPPNGPQVNLPPNVLQDQLDRIAKEIDAVNQAGREVSSPSASRCNQPVSWNRKLPGAERFVSVLNGHAICDLETGLVWEQAPSVNLSKWQSAFRNCWLLEIDGRLGWHLPTVEQLLTLVDQSQRVDFGDRPRDALPAGHPFDLQAPGYDHIFWTSSAAMTARVGGGTFRWMVDISGGYPFQLSYGDVPVDDREARIWCVRSPGGAPRIAETAFPQRR